MPHASTLSNAIRLLDDIERAAKQKRLRRGDYIFNGVDPVYEGICGGHQACLVGTAFLQAGVKPIQHRGCASLPNGWAVAENRPEAFKGRPHLRIVAELLDDLTEEVYEGIIKNHKRRGTNLVAVQHALCDYQQEAFSWTKRGTLALSEDYFENVCRSGTEARQEIARLCRQGKARLRKQLRAKVAA